MASGGQKRIKTISPNPRTNLELLLRVLESPDFRLKALFCLTSAVVLWVGTQGWAPPFPYRSGQTPGRDVYARTSFTVNDEAATKNAKSEKIRQTRCFYEHRPKPLIDLQESLINRVFTVRSAESWEALGSGVWDEFALQVANEDEMEDELRLEFEAFRQALDEDGDLSKLRTAVQISLIDFEKTGLLSSLMHNEEKGPMGEIEVFLAGNPNQSQTVDASEVRIDEVGDKLLGKLQNALRTDFAVDAADQLANHLFAWLRPRLPETLTFDEEETKRVQDLAGEQIETVTKTFAVGDRLSLQSKTSVEPQLIEGAYPLDSDDLKLLRAEHAAYVRNMTQVDRLLYTVADFGMFFAIFLLCGTYLYYRDPELLGDASKLTGLMVMGVATIIVTYWVAQDDWRAELIPILLFTMIVSTAYTHELALIMAGAVSLICTVSIGQGLAEMVVMVGTTATASFLCSTIRSRTRLVYVGLLAAAIVIPTTLGANLLMGQPLNGYLIRDALWFGTSTILSAFLMAALLPFIELFFNIQTDMRLLELGVPSHPLMQSLILRAPGTYNHSLNVASLSEAAAKEIGANTLLCRVGAYFHDIGKMCKPEYFVENQTEGNKHETLNPQMSTLIIISHVKDGVELAREHRLPQRIIDFIEQHHGTTLVEYFFDQATRQRNEHGESAELNEGNFRYPGPRPQTKEAAVVMLADACESASRSLVDPTPSRIEGLVHEISSKKLYDGQFDECSLTLKELRKIEDSLIKTINAMFHARVKYPEQQTV
ncbi:MAG: HDIG domain-containing metalloprotein [Planctomycetota bacterium]|nr:HDIG domain-containing metalloprotein [Planctomycetota bacterium]MEC8863754.1 HDIG domain-containing metalloprotein [Planctomycetota bacterium]MEC9117220.1 HDIG domain-containing metalloprotein [Planctomycetota bacterium]